MGNIDTLFSGNYIERHTELRTDGAAIRAALSDSTTRFVAIWNDRCLANENGPIELGIDELDGLAVSEETVIFLGRRSERHFFSIAIDGETEPTLVTDGSFNSLRALANSLAPDALGLVAYARAMVIWQQRHRYCGLCGHANAPIDGGFVLVCGNPDCQHRVFPRLDPAIIVLVHDGEHCLLGRQASWPEGRFSTIAGFVEPGESLEDAVRREVREESDVAVGDCQYLASQPWPFPSSLMIGFHAIAKSRGIKLNDQELAEALWFSRDDIVNGTVILPPGMSVAYKLIEAWFDQGEHPSLASLQIEAPPLTEKPGNK